jgi:DNA-binding transcriptional ArsR family regulator
VKGIAGGITDSLDLVWKALADPTRRAILDFLRDRSRTTTEIVDAFPHMTRFGVMKHLEVLRQAQLVDTLESGRQRVNSLNVVPIRQIYERWVGPFQELWSGQLLRIKDLAEGLAEDPVQNPDLDQNQDSVQNQDSAKTKIPSAPQAPVRKRKKH